MTDTATTDCANCGNNGHWYEAEPQYDDDVVVEIFSFVECPRCRFRTKAYPDDKTAADDWNSGKLVPPNAEVGG